MGFYSYLWLREDSTPYYAGKGSGNRAFKGKRYGCYRRPAHKSRIVVFPMESEALAFESEKALIELFGRKDNGTGILRNMTDGGENPPNQKGKAKSFETRRKMSLAAKGRPKSLEARRKLSQFLTGRTLSEDCRKNISEGMRRHFLRKKNNFLAPN